VWEPNQNSTVHGSLKCKTTRHWFIILALPISQVTCKKVGMKRCMVKNETARRNEMGMNSACPFRTCHVSL